MLWTRIQIRIGSDLHHFYGSRSVSIPSGVVDPHHLDADPDSTNHPDADPDQTFHPDADADPDPDPSIKKGSKSAKIGSYRTFWLAVCKLMPN